MKCKCIKDGGIYMFGLFFNCGSYVVIIFNIFNIFL